MIDRHLTELKAIAAARVRVAEGTFGICEDCGIEIEYGRMRAQPSASRCADCQGLFERMPVE
jgi:RNA polymerase-binding transcription factor DksA